MFDFTCTFPKALHFYEVHTRVHAVPVSESFGNDTDDPFIKIASSQIDVAVGSNSSKSKVREFQQCDIKGATTQIINQKLLRARDQLIGP